MENMLDKISGYPINKLGKVIEIECFECNKEKSAFVVMLSSTRGYFICKKCFDKLK